MQFSVDAPNLSHVDFPCAYSPYTPNLSHLDFPWILDAAKVNSHRTAHAAGKHPPLPRTITSVQGYSVNFRPFLVHRPSDERGMPTALLQILSFLHVLSGQAMTFTSYILESSHHAPNYCEKVPRLNAAVTSRDVQ